MIDLHLHLDGSLSPKMIIELARMQDIELSTYDSSELMKLLSVGMECESLDDYLKCFSLPLSLLQTPQAIELAIKLLLEELATKGMLYVEIRFAPQLHLNNGYLMEDILLGAISGLKNSTVKANLILCCMRGDDNNDANFHTVQLAYKYLNMGVVAVDLAGAENIYRTYKYKEVFMYARSLDIPITIHAGEADDYISVSSAISLGAKRIGHGVRAVFSDEVMEQIKACDICLELCPSSNLQTKAVSDIDSYPIRIFFDKGIKVTVNTDNMIVSSTDIANEWNIIKTLEFSELECRDILINSIQYSFADEKTKEYLMTKV